VTDGQPQWAPGPDAFVRMLVSDGDYPPYLREETDEEFRERIKQRIAESEDRE
jgi:hypothetical protein